MDEFRCPISLEVMTDPVIIETGQTFDRRSIQTWFDGGHITDPMTGQILTNRRLIPNIRLRNLIQETSQLIQQRTEFEQKRLELLQQKDELMRHEIELKRQELAQQQRELAQQQLALTRHHNEEIIYQHSQQYLRQQHHNMWELYRRQGVSQCDHWHRQPEQVETQDANQWLQSIDRVLGL